MVEGRVLVHATVTAIGDEHFLYPCCRQCCSKMLMDMVKNRWRCLKCNVSCSVEDLEWRYRIRMTVADTDEYRQISVFGKTLQPYFGASANTFHRFLSHLHVTHPDVADTALKQAVEMAFVGNNYFFGFPSANDCLDNITVSTLSMAMHRKGDNSDIVAVQMISHDHSHVTTVSECISYLLTKNLTCSFKQTFSQEDSFIDNSDFRDRRVSMKSNPGSILETSENNNEYVNSLTSILFSCENSLSNSTTSMCTSTTPMQQNKSVSSVDCTETAEECQGYISDNDTMRKEGSPMEYIPKQIQKSENLNSTISALYDLEDGHANISVTHGPREDGDFDADTLNDSSLLLADGDASPCPQASPVVSPVEVLRQESVSFDINPGGLYCSLRVQESQEEAGDETPRNMWNPSDELQDLVSKQGLNPDLPEACNFEEMPYSEDLDEFLLKTTRTKTTEAISNLSCDVRRSHERRSSSVNKVGLLKYPPENVRNIIKFRLGDSYRNENINSNVCIGAEMVKKFECEGPRDINQTEHQPEQTSPKIVHDHVIADIVPTHGENVGSIYTVDSSKVESKLTWKDKCAFEVGESGIWEELPESEDLELFLQRAEKQMDQPNDYYLGNVSSRNLRNKSQGCASLNTNDDEITSEQTSVKGNRFMPVKMDSGKHDRMADLTADKAARLIFNGRASEGAVSIGTGTENIGNHFNMNPAFDGSMELFDASGDLFNEEDDHQQSEQAGRSPCKKDASLVLDSVEESMYCPSVLETPGDGSVEHKKQVKFARRLSHISSVQLIDIRMKLTFGVTLESPSSPGRSCLRRSLVRLRRSSVSDDGYYRTRKEIFPTHCTDTCRLDRQENSENPASCQLDQSFQKLSPSRTDAKPDSVVCLQSQDLFLPSPDLFSPLSPSITQSSPSRVVTIASMSQDVTVTEAESAPQRNFPNPVQKPCGSPSTSVLELRPLCHRNSRNNAVPSNIRTRVFPDNFNDGRIVSQRSSNRIDLESSELGYTRESAAVHCVSLDDSDSGVAHSVLTHTDISGDGDCDRSLLLFSQFDMITTGTGYLSTSTPPAPCCLEEVSEFTPDLFDSP